MSPVFGQKGQSDQPKTTLNEGLRGQDPGGEVDRNLAEHWAKKWLNVSKMAEHRGIFCPKWPIRRGGNGPFGRTLRGDPEAINGGKDCDPGKINAGFSDNPGSGFGDFRRAGPVYPEISSLGGSRGGVRVTVDGCPMTRVRESLRGSAYMGSSARAIVEWCWAWMVRMGLSQETGVAWRKWVRM